MRRKRRWSSSPASPACRRARWPRPWLRAYLKIEDAAGRHARQGALHQGLRLPGPVRPARRPWPGWGQFCIDNQLAAALRGDPQEGPVLPRRRRAALRRPDQERARADGAAAAARLQLPERRGPVHTTNARCVCRASKAQPPGGWIAWAGLQRRARAATLESGRWRRCAPRRRPAVVARLALVPDPFALAFVV